MSPLVKFLRTRPFLALGIGTVLLGVIWHALPSSAVPRDSVLGSAVRFIGAPFIAAMRFSTATFGRSIVTPLAGLVLGFAPYLLAYWIVRRVRARQNSRPDPQMRGQQ